MAFPNGKNKENDLIGDIRYDDESVTPMRDASRSENSVS